jgi:uncharacterized protein (TIGR03437 family)
MNNSTPLTGGALANLLVYVHPDAPVGPARLTFSSVIATDADGQAVSLESVNGDVTVASAAGTLAIVSNASLLPGPVAPGEMVKLLGASIGPVVAESAAAGQTAAALAGRSVLFYNIPAPLIYAALNEIDLVVPQDVAGRTETALKIVNGGSTVAQMSTPVAPSAPGVFTVDMNGTGAGVILNEDFTLNDVSNPADRGSVVAIYVTGIGQQADPPAALPVTVKIGSLPADVLYKDGAPNLISGVGLVMCRVPASVEPGSAVAVIVAAGTASSQPGVTMAVR